MSPVGDGGSEKTKERRLKKTRTFQNRVGAKKTQNYQRISHREAQRTDL